jgi:hypothetical protein
MAAAQRRLVAVAIGLSPAPSSTSSTHQDDEVKSRQLLQELPELDRLAGAGALDPAHVPVPLLRRLMVPADGAPTETERLMTLLAARRTAGVGGGLDDSTESSSRHLDLDLGPLQLLGGEVSQDALAALGRRKQAAAADEDFERAGQLRDLIEVLRPRPEGPLTVDECAPPTLEGQLEFFYKNGFVILKDALSGDMLARAQAGWIAAEPPLEAQWLAARKHGKGVSRHSFREMANDAPNVARKVFAVPWDTAGNLGDDFVDLIDLPRVVPLVERLVGDTESNIYGQRRHGYARCTECGARSLPPDADGAGYTYW